MNTDCPSDNGATATRSCNGAEETGRRNDTAGQGHNNTTSPATTPPARSTVRSSPFQGPPDTTGQASFYFGLNQTRQEGTKYCPVNGSKPVANLRSIATPSQPNNNNDNNNDNVSSSVAAPQPRQSKSVVTPAEATTTTAAANNNHADSSPSDTDHSYDTSVTSRRASARARKTTDRFDPTNDYKNKDTNKNNEENLPTKSSKRQGKNAGNEGKKPTGQANFKHWYNHYADACTLSASDKDELLVVGTRVYAPYPAEESPSYYWGSITKKYIKWNKTRFDIFFDDGDRSIGFKSKFIFTEEEHEKIFRDDGSGGAGIGANHPCMIREGATNTGRKRERARKETTPSSSYAPKKRVAISGDSVVASDGSIGNSDTNSQAVEPRRGCQLAMAQPPVDMSVGSSPRPPNNDLHRGNCGNCFNCRERKICRQCDACLNHLMCFRKVCTQIPMHKKLEVASFLPPGWFFYFAEPKINEDYHGLVLVNGKNNKKYRSVERAIAFYEDEFNSLSSDPFNFYFYVGIKRVSSNGFGPAILSQNDRGIASNLSLSSSSSPSSLRSQLLATSMMSQSTAGYNTTQLYQQRCGSCYMCKRSDCGSCECCLANNTTTRTRKDTCLRNMCQSIQPALKKQRAAGFPPNWCFYFHPPSTTKPPMHKDLWGLHIVSPDGSVYSSVDEAMAAEGIDRCCADAFYDQIGTKLIVEEADHCLLGEMYFCEWISARSQKKILYGEITKVEFNLVHQERYMTVTYDTEWRNQANKIVSSCTHVPASSKIKESFAWGGFIAYCRQTGEESGNKPVMPFYYSWLVPSFRHESFALSSEGRRLPNVVMDHQGYKLTFSVKQSTIKNAGLGVFVRCDAPYKKKDKVLTLRPGELLDFGVYAPFCFQDGKKEYVFLVKNFIFEYSCEEWSFDFADEGAESQFDITNDFTGEVHEDATKHLPAYVNEVSSNDQVATVHARHDNEGAVHYLLGHEEEAYGPFSLVAGGPEIEIFVDYGPRYEDVRIRKNYSRLSPEEQRVAKIRLESQDAEYFEELTKFSAQQAREGIDFLKKISWQSPGVIADRPAGVATRILMMAICLKARSCAIIKEFHGVNDYQNVCPGGLQHISMDDLVCESRQLVQGLSWHLHNFGVLKQRLLSHVDFTKQLMELSCQENLSGLNDVEFFSFIQNM